MTFEPPSGPPLLPSPPPVEVPTTERPPSQRRGRFGVLAAVVAAVAVIAVVGGVLLLRSGGGSGFDYGNAAENVGQRPSRIDASVDTGLMGGIVLQGDNVPAAGRSSMNMSLGEMFELKVIVDAPTKQVFLGSDFLTDLIPGVGTDASWVRVDGTQAADVPGFEDLLDAIEQNDLGSTVATSILDEATSVQDLGEEEIDGETLRHYLATVPFSALIEVSPDLQQQLDEFGVDGPDDLLVDVWVTKDDWVRRMSYELELGPLSVTVEATISELPSDFAIELPADGEFVDLTDLIPG